MTQKNNYQRFAKIYDEITKDSNDFLVFFNRFIRNSKARNSKARNSKARNRKAKILDVGCGTGRQSIELAKKGFSVAGVDPAKVMIDIARKKAPKNKKIKFYCGELQKLNIKECFDFVISSETVNHITDKKKLLALFKAIIPLLDKKGRFVFDLITKTHFEEAVLEREYGGRIGNDYFAWEEELKKTAYHFKISIFMKKKENIYERYQESYIQRIYSLSEIKTLLRKAGFSKIKVEKKKFDLYFVAEK